MTDSVAPAAASVTRALARSRGAVVEHRSVARARELVRAVGEARPRVVFNLCESLEGETRLEPDAAARIQQLGVAFTGSPSAPLRACLHKLEAALRLERAGVPVPATWLATSVGDLATFEAELALPVIVKPSREDGSRGISPRSVVTTRRRLREQVADVTERFGQPAIVQRYVEGRELNVSLLVDATGELEALPVGEIAFRDMPKAHPEILTFDAKWNTRAKAYRGSVAVAAELDPALERAVVAVAKRAFTALGLRGYGRVDLRVDALGRPFVIDVNPNCDLSEDGGFAKAAARAGLAYDEVLWRIVDAALVGRRTARAKPQPVAMRRAS